MVQTDRAAWDRAAQALPPTRHPIVPSRVSHSRAAASRIGAAAVPAAPIPPIAKLREYVNWFMTGGPLEERLRESDGRLTAINVEWTTGADNVGQGAIELRFSNDMVTTPPYLIIGLTAADIEMVISEVDEAAATREEEILPADPAIVRQLEGVASCKLSSHEALLLQRSRLECPICLAPFAAGHSILCLPCGRIEQSHVGSSSEACLGHLGHVKCLKASFARRAGCPLCRINLPTSSEGAASAALGQAKRNLQHLKLQAELLQSMSKASAAIRRGGGGANALHTSTGRKSQQLRATGTAAWASASSSVRAGAGGSARSARGVMLQAV